MKKVLVVEDDERIRNTMVEIIGTLSDADLTIMVAKDGKEGLDLLLREMVDILVTDISMPNMDGIEMVKEVKNKVWGNNCPLVIFFSGDEVKYLRIIKKHMERFGIERVFVFEKPFSNEDLEFFLSLIKAELK